MSNIIKASSILYNNDEKRELDLNTLAQDRIDTFLRLDPVSVGLIKSQQSDTFVPGLPINEEQQQEEAIASLTVDSAQAAITDSQREEEQLAHIHAETEKILSQAKDEVKRILAEAEEQAQKRKAEILKDAHKIGYEEGQKQAQQEVAEKLAKLQNQITENQMQYEKQVRELEPAFVDLTAALVQKLTGIMMDSRKNILIYLMEQALLHIEPSNVYLIHVAPVDYEDVASLKTNLKWKVHENAQIEIIEDTMLQKNQCLIETDSRIFDCSLDVQMQHLLEDLRLLSGEIV